MMPHVPIGYIGSLLVIYLPLRNAILSSLSRQVGTITYVCKHSGSDDAQYFGLKQDLNCRLYSSGIHGDHSGSMAESSFRGSPFVMFPEEMWHEALWEKKMK
ncbi:Heat shock 70 kDa protein 1A/1B [Platysternon megacephalum]|uniref:Heat shock 70 kDa protein 1A/1B n=1 Tax=Platysternon megacephalum TaxID=55544 RepID=A0A4D9EZ34_9SAUR|nr:Heat shock 70 kDa protein 1A/1B [Platysternon megacephalum]